MPRRSTEMTGPEFTAWQDGLELSNRGAAARLGVSENSVANFRKAGAGLTVALACSAISAGLAAWPVEGADRCRAAGAVMEALRIEAKSLATSKM